MKRFLPLFVIVLMLAGLIMPASIISFGEETSSEKNYVRFTSGNFDPYAVYNFSENGKNTEIDADLVKYCAIRYRTITFDNESGIELGAQIYVVSAKEPYIPVIYNHTNNWETVIVDMSTISVTKEGMDSVWNSDDYSNPSQIRFDMMEPNREDPDFDNENDRGHVRDKSQIDIAWVAFFEKEEDAKAYTGSENTPYCLLDADTLSDPVSVNNVNVELFKDDTKQKIEKLEEIAVNPTDSTKHAYNLGEKELAIHTMKIPDGYVMQDLILGGCPTWSNTEGNSDVVAEVYIWRGDYDSSTVGKPIATIEVLNHQDNQYCYFNFGTSLRYGYEYLILISRINDGAFGFWTGTEIPQDTGFEVYIDGELEEAEVPFILYTLKETEELPDYDLTTSEPTATPTETPIETKTIEPTATPTTEPTVEPTEEPKSSGCGNVINLGFSTICISAVLLFIRKKQ